jgi:hypothetical protein
MGVTCSTYWDVGNPQGYKPFRRPTCGWDNVVKCTLNNWVCTVWSNKIAWGVEQWQAVVYE